MQRKILAVEKCACYGGKRSFKGESIQMKKQILEVSGELRMLKLQVTKFFLNFFGEAKTNANNLFLYPQDRAAVVPAVSISAAQCSTHTQNPASLDASTVPVHPTPPGILHKAPHAQSVHFLQTQPQHKHPLSAQESWLENQVKTPSSLQGRKGFAFVNKIQHCVFKQCGKAEIIFMGYHWSEQSSDIKLSWPSQGKKLFFAKKI